LKNNALKKTEVTLANYSIVKDAIKGYAYKNFNGSYLYVNFYGKINEDFRVLAVIGEVKNDDYISKIDLSKYDKKFNFGAYDITNEVKSAKNCTFFKLNQSEILRQILLYISYEKFEGGYFAKGKFSGQDINDLEFIGICGDIKNKKKIKSLKLDKIRLTMPKLTIENYFYISEFIDLS